MKWKILWLSFIGLWAVRWGNRLPLTVKNNSDNSSDVVIKAIKKEEVVCDYLYMIKQWVRFVAVKGFTLRVIFSQNPRCQLWFNSWMSPIKITKQHVATWSECIWLISVTVDAVYKVCPCQWWWCRDGSQTQPSGGLARWFKHQAPFHMFAGRGLLTVLLKKGLCKLHDIQNRFYASHTWQQQRIILWGTSVDDVPPCLFFLNGTDISCKAGFLGPMVMLLMAC